MQPALPGLLRIAQNGFTTEKVRMPMISRLHATRGPVARRGARSSSRARTAEAAPASCRDRVAEAPVNEPRLRIDLTLHAESPVARRIAAATVVPQRHRPTP